MSIVTEAPKAGSSMPEWFAPRVEQDEPVLRVYNSLTRRKVRDCGMDLACR